MKPKRKKLNRRALILRNFYALLNTALVYNLFIPFLFVLTFNRCCAFCGFGFAHFQFRSVEIIKSTNSKKKNVKKRKIQADWRIRQQADQKNIETREKKNMKTRENKTKNIIVMHIQVQVELQMKIPSRDGEAEVEKKNKLGTG